MSDLPYSYLDFACDADESVQRILLVDDETRLRQSYRELLQGLGAEIVECGDGRAAIRALEQTHFDVVLLDLKLPDMSGLEVLQWATRTGLAATIIIVSSATHIDAAIGALRGGAYEFLRKPCDPDQLVRTTTQVLQHKRLEHRHALMTARLEQSERLHRFLVEQSPDIVYTLDERGCFVFINGRIESLRGFGSCRGRKSLPTGFSVCWE